MDLLNSNNNLIYTNHFNKIVYNNTYVYNSKNLFESIKLKDNIITIKYNNYEKNNEFDKFFYSCGINFTNNLYIDDGLYKLSFKAKASNEQTLGKKFKIYNGSKWIIVNKLLTNNFETFYMDSEFYFNKSSKWRLSLFKNEYGDQYQIKDLFLTKFDNDKEYELNNIDKYIKIIFVTDNKYLENMIFYTKCINNYFKCQLKNFDSNILFFTHNQQQHDKVDIDIREKDFMFFMDYINTNFKNKASLNSEYKSHLEYIETYNNINCNKILIQNYESISIRPNFYFDIQKLEHNFAFTNHYYFNRNNNNYYYLSQLPVYNDNIIKYNPKKYFMCIQPISSGFNKKRFFILKKFILNLDNYISNNLIINNKLDIHFYTSNLSVLKNFVDELSRLIKNFNIVLKGTIEHKEKKMLSQRLRSQEKLEIYKNYKFNIVLENNFHDFYFTEKFYDILYGNSISIYFGSPNINLLFEDIFDNGGVINGFDFYKNNNFADTFLKKILTMTEEEIEKKINSQHLLLNRLDNINQKNFWEFIIHTITNSKSINLKNNYYYLLNDKIQNLKDKIILKPFLDKYGNIL